MKLKDFLELLGDRVPYEFRGNPEAPFRGLGLKSQRRGVRRCLYVLPEVSWHPEYPRMLRKDERPAELEFETALNMGASGIVSPPEYRNLPLLNDRTCLFVEDTLAFTYYAADAIRRALTEQKVVGVTGSAGKSTTKLMLAAALRAAEPDKRVQVVRENRNIAAQVLWQASWMHGYDYNLLEVAGSAFLKFPQHDYSLSPDIAIVTSIAEAHLTYMGSLQKVAEHKSRIFDRGPAGAVGLINTDTPKSDYLIEQAQRGGYRPLRYGSSGDADIRLLHYSPESGEVVAASAGAHYKYRLGAHGRHMAINSLAVIGALESMGVPNVQAALDALATFEAAPGRGNILEVTLPNGTVVHVTDESYNANPASMRAAVAAFTSRPTERAGRKVAVLGDIAELGDDAPAIHRSLHDTEGLLDLDEVHLFGPNMRHLYEAISHPGAHYWENLDVLAAYLLEALSSGDHLLTKASHSTGLHSFVQSLTMPSHKPATSPVASGTAQQTR